LGICGEVCFLSDFDDFKVFSGTRALSEIKDYGYTLVTDDEDTDPEVLELTLQDIADKFEVDVKTIKIKEVER